MKFKNITLVLLLILFGCSTTSSNFNGKLSKLAPTMIKMYIEGNGCKGTFKTKIVGALPKIDNAILAKEHWQVEACGKVHNLELSLSKDGKNVSTKKLM